MGHVHRDGICNTLGLDCHNSSHETDKDHTDDCYKYSWYRCGQKDDYEIDVEKGNYK